MYKTESFVVVFVTYESHPSVAPVEQKRKRLETDILPESRWQPYKNISPREQRKYSQLLFFLQNKLDFPKLDKVCKWALLHSLTEEQKLDDSAAAIST